MPASFFENLLGGFSDSSREARREKTQVAERRSELENRILLSLAQSPDPEISTLAVAGLVGPQTQAKGKKGLSGLAGFITEVEGNPVLGPLRDLIQSERTVMGEAPDPNTLPSAPITGQAAVPGGGPVADPSVSPSRPGAAGLAGRSPIENVPGQSPQLQATGPVAAAAPQGSAIPPQVSAQVGEVSQPTVPVITGSEPRQIFRSPGQIAQEQGQGRIEGQIAGIQGAELPPQQEQAAILGSLGAPQAAASPINVMFGDGTTGVVTQLPDGSFQDASGSPRQDIIMVIPNNAFSGGGSTSRQTVTTQPQPGVRRVTDINTGEVVFEGPNLQLPATPPFQAGNLGTVTLDDGRRVTVTQDRQGNLTVAGGAATQAEPPSVADAGGILTAVEAEVAARSLGGVLPPDVAEINQIVTEFSEGEFTSLAALKAAATRGVQRERSFDDIVGQPFEEVQGGPREPSSPSIDFNVIREQIQENRRRLNTPQ